MKKSILSVLLILLVVISCTEQKTCQYKFNWDFTNMVDLGYSIDSANIIVNDKVYQSVKGLKDNQLIIEGTIDEPSIATVEVFVTHENTPDSFNVNIILEEGNITIDPDAGCGTGAPLNDAVLNLYKNIMEAAQKKNVKYEDICKIISEFVNEHKDDISSVFILANSDFTSTMSASDLTKLVGTLSDNMKAQPAIKKLNEKIELMSRTAVGKQFVDFEAEYEGKVQKLSDYVGKGKYALVDFWASWCGPCRAEIPNIKKVYKKYGDKINVVGVASWDKPEDTKAAIEELGIKYPQIMNAQSAGTDAYSIEGIPEIILFTPDGRILKRGLREGEIMKAVKEVIK